LLKDGIPFQKWHVLLLVVKLTTVQNTQKSKSEIVYFIPTTKPGQSIYLNSLEVTWQDILLTEKRVNGSNTGLGCMIIEQWIGFRDRVS